jgi:Xaa-Pro dipeptidase
MQICVPMTTAKKRDLGALFVEHLKVICERSDHALEAVRADRLVIYSGALSMLFLDDQAYPFKTNPHFKAWAPILDNPDCFIVYSPGTRPILLFHQPVDYWYKPPALPTEFWVGHFDLRPIASLVDARSQLRAELARSVFVGELPAAMSDWGFAAVNPQALLDRLHYERATKTAYEVECMRRATALAVRGHRAAERAFRNGESEYGAHMAYLAACDQREEELPYNNIVAYNANGAVLHYQYLERAAPRADERRSLLIDAGAQFNGYACDITRTYAAHDGAFATLVEAVDRAQQSLCGEVRPGIDYCEFQLRAHGSLAQVLRDADVIATSADEAVESGLSRVFFPHGIGHLLGLQVHDVGGFMRDETGARIEPPATQPFLRLTRKLEPGFAVTVEPGIYFIDSLLKAARANGHAASINWKRVDELRPYGGIRVEDDVVVTSGGHENLTRNAFAQLAG